MYNVLFRFLGKIETDEELLLMVKTDQKLVDRVIGYVEENHPYDSPEVITTKIEEGRKDYLDWIGQNTLVSDDSTSKGAAASAAEDRSGGGGTIADS